MVSPPELALAALVGSYIDSKLLLREDIRNLVQVGLLTLRLKLRTLRGQASFWYTIEELARKRPNHLALVYLRPVDLKDGKQDFIVERYSFKQMQGISLQYAYVLKHQYGVKSGDTVAMDMTNSSQFIFLWFGIWSLGAIPAFINYNLTENSLVHCAKVVTPKLFIYEPEIAHLVDPVLGEIGQFVPQIALCDDNFTRLVAESPAYLAPDSDRCPRNDWDTAVLIYTSGTTGLPKAAALSWAKCGVGAGSYGKSFGFKDSDIHYTAMPLYHSTAATLCVNATLSCGGAIAIGHKFSTSTFWTQVRLSKATIIQYVGETCRYLLLGPYHPDERNHCVRMANGNGLRPDVWRQFKERFNIASIGEFYGSTEAPTALTNIQNGESGIGSVGRYGMLVNFLSKRLRYRLAAVDPQDTEQLWRDPKTGLCRDVKVNEPGEILFRIANPEKVHETFQGYTDKKASKNKVVLDVFKKGDAWVRNGDLLKRDHDGYFYFVDRMGDTFRWKSENVSTNEVEHVIGAVDGVDQAVVVGVNVPNHEGRAGLAIIKPTDPNHPPSIEAVRDHLIKELPRYAVPIFFKYVDDIETTGNNKIQKVKYRNQKLPTDSETIYVLNNQNYEVLGDKFWGEIVAGRAKL